MIVARDLVKVFGRRRVVDGVELQVEDGEVVGLLARTAALAIEHEEADLDEIATGGAMRIAAESLRDDAFDERLAAGERRVAAAALNRLYGYLQEVEA